MTAVRAWLAGCLLAASAIAAAAPPQLVVPHGRLGQSGTEGPSALWRGDSALFAIETSGDIRAAVGEVQRRAFEVAENGAISYAPEPAWSAALLLAGATKRNIFTSDQSGLTYAFEWAQLPPATQALLDVLQADAKPDGLGEQRTAFLRGERTGEEGQTGGVFRKRAGVLGDIVHSTPIIVGAPPASIAESGHAAFRDRYKTRDLAVYVGANDGMLHAFSAATGAELFAYVPAALASQLSTLSSPAYKPQAYADGSPGYGEARIGANWRTVLASGMGMGARGVFALDISDPARFGEGLGALWEFTDAHDPAMGHVRAAPLIAKISRDKGVKDAAQRYYAVVSSGINNFAPGGAGALFLLALDKPAGQEWKSGLNFFSISTTGGDALLANALSPPALVVLAAGSANRAYAGDLRGNLWRFDFANMTARRLFTARDASGAPQPIAHAPKVVFAPGGGYLILFGTGKLIEESDLLPASFSPQSVYAILDAPGALQDSATSRSQLAVRTLAPSSAGYAVSGAGFTYFGPDAKKGWYFDFPDAGKNGERAAGSPVSIESVIVVASMLPAVGEESAATGRLYLLDALTGFAYDPASGIKPGAATGELSPFNPLLPLLFVNAAASKGERSATGGTLSTRRVTLVRPHSSAGAPPAIKFDLRYPSGRMGWREVSNWRELHQAATGKRR